MSRSSVGLVLRRVPSRVVPTGRQGITAGEAEGHPSPQKAEPGPSVYLPFETPFLLTLSFNVKEARLFFSLTCSFPLSL